MVAPSILSADFGNLERDIMMLNQSNAHYIHIDVMDGVFVPNISFGFPILKYVNKIATKPLDVHLMIVQPERYVNEFIEAGASNLTVHYEACTHLHRCLQQIKLKNVTAGVSLNPHTPINLLEDIIIEADLILIMSVNPGFGGQSFIENSYKRISECKELILRKNLNTLIQVDGGINTENAPLLYKAGADILVAGNSVFTANDPLWAIQKLTK